MDRNGSGPAAVEARGPVRPPTRSTPCGAAVDVAGDPDAVRRRIGAALQEAGLGPRQNGRERLVLQARLLGMTTAEATESRMWAVGWTSSATGELSGR